MLLRRTGIVAAGLAVLGCGEDHILVGPGYDPVVLYLRGAVAEVLTLAGNPVDYVEAGDPVVVTLSYVPSNSRRLSREGHYSFVGSDRDYVEFLVGERTWRLRLGQMIVQDELHGGMDRVAILGGVGDFGSEFWSSATLDIRDTDSREMLRSMDLPESRDGFVVAAADTGNASLNLASMLDQYTRLRIVLHAME